MSEPITDVGERTRRELLAKGDPYRSQLLDDVAKLITHVEDIRNEQAEDRRWRIQHDKDDAVRFSKGDDRMAAIEKSIDGSGGIRSGFNDYKDKSAQIRGAKNFVIAIVLIIGTAYGAIKGIGEIVAYWVTMGRHP